MKIYAANYMVRHEERESKNKRKKTLRGLSTTPYSNGTSEMLY